MGEEAFIKEQMRCAIALGDNERKIKHSIELKEIFFGLFGNSFVFDKCPSLKTPEEFVKGKIIGKKKTKAQMLVWEKVFKESFIPYLHGVACDPYLSYPHKMR